MRDNSGMAERTGHVWIAGAGPGDPELVTLAAVRALEQANVVIYDALVAPAVLRHARRDAELIYAGKRAGQQELTQREIEALLVQRALEGQRVVRLKGGDPLVFGRGGEEALACRAAGIRYTIVPGITSALAAPAYAGIPATHRGLAESFLVITAQAADGREPRWEAAAAADTVIVLMGRERLASVCSNLIAAGKTPDTPAATVRWGTRHDQRVLTATLGTLPQLADESGLESPIVTVVGPVAALARDLDWFQPGLLAGKRVVVTRARDQSSDLAGRLIALGAHVIEAPVIETTDRRTDADMQRAVCSHPDWLVFASASGVRACFAALEFHGADARHLAGTRIAAIADATRTELLAHGLRADFVPSTATSDSLARELPAARGESVLFLCSSLTDDNLARALGERGIKVAQVIAYDTHARPLDDQTIREVLDADAITFTSASTARNLRASLPDGAVPAHAQLISIGNRTSDALVAAFGRVDRKAGDPSLDALVSATLEALR